MEKKEGWIEKINSSLYEIGKKLGEGGFGRVYEGTRLSDGLKVAVKYTNKYGNLDYISIPGYSASLPREVALMLLVCNGDEVVPEIIQLLDWEDFEDCYIMVLERFTPCMDLSEFLEEKEKVDEEMVKIITKQAAVAAQICCQRGVFHRDIKLENFLINPDTLKIKLIDFGCGDFLNKAAYTEFMGTVEYFGPEYFKTREYHAMPTTVYSLGVMMFTLLYGRFPEADDKKQIKKNKWKNDGLSKECRSLIKACLRVNPEKRIDLEKIKEHKWFQADAQQTVIENPDKAESVIRLSDGEIPLAMGADHQVSYGEIFLPVAADSQPSSEVFLHHRQGSDEKNDLPSDTDWRASYWKTQLPLNTNRQPLKKLKKQKIDEINSLQYEIWKKLGRLGFGSVYKAKHLIDVLKEAVKYVRKPFDTDYISIGNPKPLPKEVALQVLSLSTSLPVKMWMWDLARFLLRPLLQLICAADQKFSIVTSIWETSSLTQKIFT